MQKIAFSIVENGSEVWFLPGGYSAISFAVARGQNECAAFIAQNIYHKVTRTTHAVVPAEPEYVTLCREVRQLIDRIGLGDDNVNPARALCRVTSPPSGRPSRKSTFNGPKT